MRKRVLSLVLTFCMLIGLLPAPVLAAEPEDSVHCIHVHDEACGYVEPVPEQPCGHIHDEACGYAASGEGVFCAHVHDETCGYVEAAAEQPCVHTHDEACGYIAPSEGTPCAHTHDETCGFAEAVPEVPCDMDCEDTDGDGTIDHDPACGYTPAVEGQPCVHVHDEACGYTAPNEGTPCTHVHDETCGWAPAVEGLPCNHVCTVESGCLDPEPVPAEPVEDESLQLQVEEADEALQEAGYSVVLTLPGEWDSCDWQAWSGEEEGWTSLGAEDPTLPLPKEFFVSFAFRCVVEKNGETFASAPCAYHEEALTAPLGSGVNTLAWGWAPFETHWKDSAYIAVAPTRFNGYCFDVYGIENGSDYKTTYMNGGYIIGSEVDGTKLCWGSEPNADVSMGGSLTGRFAYDIVYGGRYVKITYTVKNNGSTEKTFKVGSSGDVMIDQNDKAEVRGTAMGLQMDDKAGKKFNLVVPTATTKWFGYFNKAYPNMFTDMNTDTAAPYSGDSGMAWSWTATVKPGRTWTRYALIGVGEMPEPLAPPEISIRLDDSKNYVIPGEAFSVSGTAAGASVVYIDVGGKEYEASVAASGSFTTQAAVPEDAPEGPLEIQAWAVNDGNGAMSETVTETVNVRHAPYLYLTATETSVVEEESLDENWYKGFIKSTNSTNVTHTSVNTNTLSDQTATYTADLSPFSPATATLRVHILPKPAELSQTTTAQSGKNFTLKSTMRYTGGLTYTETGFVYGSFQNPSLGFNDGQVISSPTANSKGAQLSATASGLIDNTVYYARAYAKASDGTVVYGPQSAGFGLGVPSYGTFHIKNNGNNTFTIYRDSDQADGEQKVYYRTVNGSAVGMLNGDKYNFRHADGVLTFADGEYTKTVTVKEFSNHAIYDSYVGTQYANADRTYQMEINRVEGGAIIDQSHRFATRNMGHSGSYTVDRNVYTTERSGGQVSPSSSVYWVADHSGGDGADIWFVSDRKKNSGTDANYSFTYKPTYNEYLQNTITGWLYRYSITAHETENGYEHVWVGKQAPSSNGSKNNKVAGDGAAIPLNSSVGTALFTGSFEMWENSDLAVKVPQVGCGVADACDGRLRNVNGTGNMKTAGSNSYLVMGKDDTAYCYFSANGGGSEYWYIRKHTSYDLPLDTTEPKLIDVAYMARSADTTTYLPGDPITISLVFDEIVDGANSRAAGFGSESYVTMEDWGGTKFKYAGGLDTNVLYFTAITPEDAPTNSGNLKVNLNCAGQIKDMCPDNGTAPSNGPSSTAPVAKNPVPTVTVGNITNNSGTLTAAITASNADRLEYAWTNSNATPTSGWRKLSNKSGETVTTRQSSGTWYLHARATNADGKKATDCKGVSIPTSGSGALVLPTLTASVDNSAWAKERTIILGKTPISAAVQVIAPGSSTATTVSGASYIATANGTYTFTLTSGDETATAMATVSKLDLNAPTVSIDTLPNITYVQPVTLTVHAADSESGIQSVTGTWSNGSKTVTAAFTGSNGVYTTTSPGETGAWTLNVTAKDNVGWPTTINSAAYTLNLNVPIVTVTQTGTNPNGSVNYTYSVDMNGQTVQTVQLPDGTVTTALNGSFTLTSPGTYYVVVTDTAGHLVRSKAMTVAETPSNPVDGEPPEVRLSQDTEAWVNAANGVTVTVNAYDNIAPTGATWKLGSGSANSIPLSQDAAAKMGNQAKMGAFKATSNGTYTVTVQDGRNNTASTEIVIENIDPTAPVIGAPTGNPTAWTPNAATIKFNVTDDQSGVNTVTVKKGAANVTVANNSGNCSFTATENGDYVITATDNVGNTSTETVSVTKIDKTAPAISVTGGATAAASLELTVNATNAGGSGIKTTTVSKDGGAAKPVTGGKYTVSAAGTYVFTATTGTGQTKSQTVNVYSIAFNENGGSAVTDQIVVSGGKVAQPTVSKTGYALSGWMNGTANWNFASSAVTANTTLTAQWTLDAPTVTVTADPTNGAATYTGSPVVTLTANPSHAASGLTYSYQWYKDNRLLSGETASTLKLTTVADNGSYKVKVTASDGTLTSAERASAATTVTISKAAPTLSGLSATAITYGQPLSASTPSGTAKDPKTNADVLGAWSWSTGEGSKHPTVAGDSNKTEYSVTFTPADANNYAASTATVTLTVNKAVLTPSVNTVANKVYDGTTAATGTIKLAGAVLNEGPAATGTFAFNSPNVTEANAVNVTGITLTDPWNDNYVLSTASLADISTTAKITPKPVTLTWSGDTGLVYDGQPVNVTAAAGALVGSDTCAVTVEGGQETNAGTHTAKAVSLDNSNYKLPAVVTKEYAIDPKPIVLHWHNMIQTYTGGDLTPKAVAKEEDAPAVTLAGVEAQDDGLAGLTIRVTRDGKAAAPVDAGTYTVTGQMSGGNYTVTGSAALTIQKAPVSFAVTNNSMKEGETRHGAAVTPSPAGVSFTAVYKNQKGEVVDPAAEDLKAGTYPIWVTITDDNYRHAGRTDGKAVQLGVFTVYAQTPPPKYAVKFEAEDPEDEETAEGGTIGVLEGSTQALGEAEAGTLRTLPNCGYTCSGYAFTGWKLGNTVYHAGAAYTQEAREVTFTAQWVKTVHTVEGVVDQDGKPISDVQVTLMLGANRLAEQYTRPDGKFLFPNVAPGRYNLVAAKDGITMTVEAAIVDQDEGRAITLPTHKTNSIVEVIPGTPDIVVGNLEENFTEADKALAEESESTVVEYKFTVEQVPEDKENKGQQEILKAAGGATPALYLDLTLERTQTVGDKTESTNMPESNVLLKSVIPLPAGLQGKYGYSVVRFHGEGEAAKAETLTTSKNAGGEYIEVSGDKTVLTIYAMRFSTYAVAYTNPPPISPSDSPSGGPSGGSSGDGPSDDSSETTPVKPTIEQPEHGEIGITPSEPEKGDKVEITVTPDDGYEVDQVIVTDEDGKPVEVTRNPDGTYTYTQPRGKVTISARLKASYDVCPKDETCPIWPYTDASTVAWYHDGVHYCIDNGLMTGYGNGLFGPDKNLSRGMLAQILYNREGKPVQPVNGVFTDVTSGAWYAQAVEWAAARGIVSGYGNGRFGPDDPITREQLAVMLWRNSDSPAATNKELHFTDADEISGWALEAMRWAVENSIISGYGNGRLGPRGLATRAQAAQLLMKILQNTEA